MNRRSLQGFTLIEIVIVVVLMGAILAIALPRVADTFRKQRVQNAAAAVENIYVKARTIAMQRSSYTRIAGLQSGVLTIFTLNPVTGAWEFSGNTEDVGARYGVSINSAPYDQIWVNHLGLGYYAEDTVTISSGSDTVSLKISKYGRITR